MIGQFILNGFITGVLYSVLAIGFALVYNTTKLFHIVAAAIYVFAAYMFYMFAATFGVPLFFGGSDFRCVDYGFESADRFVSVSSLEKPQSVQQHRHDCLHWHDDRDSQPLGYVFRE